MDVIRLKLTFEQFDPMVEEVELLDLDRPRRCGAGVGSILEQWRRRFSVEEGRSEDVLRCQGRRAYRAEPDGENLFRAILESGKVRIRRAKLCETTGSGRTVRIERSRRRI